MINVMYEITFTFQIILYNILFNVCVEGIIQLNDTSAASLKILGDQSFFYCLRGVGWMILRGIMVFRGYQKGELIVANRM